MTESAPLAAPPDGVYLALTASIVSAYFSHNTVSPDKVPGLIAEVHAALTGQSSSGNVEPLTELEPAVPVRKSVTDDYIVCLEDGKKFKSLKRHLRTHFDLSPEQYREKWGLPPNYPMAAPSYSAARSQLAKNSGLGRKR